MFGELLWKRWELVKGDGIESIDAIRGFWAEDGSPFYINAPYQLVESIVILQNRLSDVYNDVLYLEGRAAMARELFRKMIGKD